MPTIDELFGEVVSSLYLKHFVSVEFNRFIDYYRNAPDLSVSLKEGKKGRKRRSEKEFSRFFINSSTQDSLTPPSLLGLVNETTRQRDIEIGRIDIMKKFSFFEVDFNCTNKVIKAFADAEHEGRKIVVELAQDRNESSEFRGAKTKIKAGKKKNTALKRKTKRTKHEK